MIEYWTEQIPYLMRGLFFCCFSRGLSITETMGRQIVQIEKMGKVKLFEVGISGEVCYTVSWHAFHRMTGFGLRMCCISQKP